MIRKLIIANGRSDREILLVGNIVIGRDPACHVSESDPLLSRRHAEIVASVHGVSVRDLDSRNGILVNGEKTHEQVLLPGDVVQMGHLQLRYVEEDARQTHGRDNRGHERPSAPPPPAPPPPPSFDRFRPEQPAAAAPGRWTPEPTPLPGRRTTAAPPPPPRAPSYTPLPRGRAAFEERVQMPGAGEDASDQMMAGYPTNQAATPGSGAADLDATTLAPAQGWQQPGAARWTASEPTMHAAAPSVSSDATMVPGDATFASALAHLAGLGSTAPGGLNPGPGARLTANAELTITDATQACAEMLGIPDEQLVGDSLTEVFVRGVRRAYTEPGSTLSLSIGRGSGGSIAVTFTFDKASGTE